MRGRRGPSTRIARSPMNGARNLACGSPGPTAGTGEVNSWPTSESLLHSRRCELPFEISIFYAYTWVICRRLAYRRATQFRLVQRRRGVHLRLYTYVCMHARIHTIAKLRSRRARKARELFLLLSTRLCHDLAYACRVPLSRCPTSSYHGQGNLGLYVPRRSMPLASGLRSYLATRLLRSKVPSI